VVLHLVRTREHTVGTARGYWNVHDGYGCGLHTVNYSTLRLDCRLSTCRLPAAFQAFGSHTVHTHTGYTTRPLLPLPLDYGALVMRSTVTTAVGRTPHLPPLPTVPTTHLVCSSSAPLLPGLVARLFTALPVWTTRIHLPFGHYGVRTPLFTLFGT